MISLDGALTQKLHLVVEPGDILFLQDNHKHVGVSQSSVCVGGCVCMCVGGCVCVSPLARLHTRHAFAFIHRAGFQFSNGRHCTFGKVNVGFHPSCSLVYTEPVSRRVHRDWKLRDPTKFSLKTRDAS